jgi:lipopolysaccharide/colanic/teichoic acid biosynthesis glycosyltransferase
MHVVPLILDSDFEALGLPRASGTLLTLPFGTSTLLEQIAPRLSRFGNGEIIILPTFQPGSDYTRRLRSNGQADVRVLDYTALDALLDDQETSDFLLVIDPRLWPLDGYDFEHLEAELASYRGATFTIACDIHDERIRERVECDTHGRVRRVQRFYSSMDWPDDAVTRVSCAAVPARSAIGLHFTAPADLRTALHGRGILQRDLPLESNVIDLSQPQGILALSELMIGEHARRSRQNGYTESTPGVHLGKGCHIDPSVRIVAPVLIQSNVTIEHGATIIGPSLLGSGSRVRRDAVVAQALLSQGADVPREASIRHQISDGSNGTQQIPAELRPVSNAREMTVLSDRATTRRRVLHLAIKRMFDITASLAGLLVLWPIMIVTAIIIKLDSEGPVFFAHRRERKDGQEFACLKFRTMRADAHQLQRTLYSENLVDGPQFKLKQDPRLTRIGGWLRKSNIDELPQLLNVLVGHMSLVGPRPSPFRENQICVPWRRARLSVRPGITGLWQICRDNDRSEGDFQEWIYYDITYVRHFSFWLDLKILFATFCTLGGRWNVPISRLIPSIQPPEPDAAEREATPAPRPAKAAIL